MRISFFLIINDDYQLAIKDFFKIYELTSKKNRWASKCKLFSLSITDTHQASEGQTSNRI
jgi:hypothetical protein